MSSRLVEQLGVQKVAGASASGLAEQIRALILDGRLTAGERLPSERALAIELRRSRSTITRTYSTLEDAGFVVRVHGGSTRVALPHIPLPPTTGDDESSIDLSIAS
jgi:DNA-binding GntR family transcriptional regulator